MVAPLPTHVEGTVRPCPPVCKTVCAPAHPCGRGSTPPSTRVEGGVCPCPPGWKVEYTLAEYNTIVTCDLNVIFLIRYDQISFDLVVKFYLSIGYSLQPKPS